MIEVVFEGVAASVDEGTIQAWFVEEGDSVTEGDDLVELATSNGVVVIPAPKTGILSEVYYDEGETIAKGEVLCCLDDEADTADDEEEEE